MTRELNEGFDKANTNRIAEVAGVSVGSLYQYFPSKEAFVAAVAERHNRDILDVIGGTLTEMESLPLERGAACRAELVSLAPHEAIRQGSPSGQRG